MEVFFGVLFTLLVIGTAGLFLFGVRLLQGVAKDVEELYRAVTAERRVRPSSLLMNQMVSMDNDYKLDDIQLLLESVDGKLAQLLENKMESDDLWDAYDECLDEDDTCDEKCSASKCYQESCKPPYCHDCPSAVADPESLQTVTLSDNAACGYVGAVAEAVTEPDVFMGVDVHPVTVAEATIHPQGNTIPSDGTLRQDTEWEAYANQDLLACRKKMHEEKPLLKPYRNTLWDSKDADDTTKGPEQAPINKYVTIFKHEGKSYRYVEQDKDDEKKTTESPPHQSSQEAQ